ncbi:MAG: DnaA/Hda family protein [Gemmatimonadota bacterium]
MTPLELNQRFTFDNFVVGQANRLAAAAGRRVADNPGQAYNPLFIYSSSGLGKTHLLNAIGQHAARLHPNIRIVYDTLGHFLDEALEQISAGQREAFRSNVAGINFLLLDDVQFLTDRRMAQEELLRAWDVISSAGGQVVLASDRPPSDINGLDDRLLSRVSGGLIADIGLPDYETRVVIVNRKAAEGGQTLSPGVAEALAKVSFGNVRELQGGLNKLLAVQDLDNRQVAAAEIPAMFGQQQPSRDEFGGFRDEISGTVGQRIEATMVEGRLAEAILHWQGEGFSIRRLEAALESPPGEDAIDAFLAEYIQDATRLMEIERDVRLLEPNAPELARTDRFRSPDLLADAEALLAAVRERNRPVPAPPPGRSFQTLSLPADSFALRAARLASEQPGEKYNPFFVYGPEGGGKSMLLAALANELAERNSTLPVAFVYGKHFAAEVIQAIEQNCVDSWRARYRQVSGFIVDDVDGLLGTELAQEELFHLFEDLKRAGVQLAFGSTQRPGLLTGLEERLRSRLESGLVVSLAERTAESAAPVIDPATRRKEWLAAVDATATETGESVIDDWFMSQERVVWRWPYLEDWLIEELE